MAHFSFRLTIFLAAAISSLHCSVQRSFQPEIPNGGRAMALSFDPSDERRIMVASETGGLFQSTDGGNSWNQVSGNSTFGFTHVLYFSRDIIIATASRDMKVISGGGIWRSIDGGKTWSKPALTAPTTACSNDMQAFCLAKPPGSDTIWAGTGCGLAYSADKGANWTFLPPKPNYRRDRIFALLAPTSKDLKVLTNDGVIVSADGGNSWSVSRNGLPNWTPEKDYYNQIALSPFNHRHIFWTFNYRTWTLLPDSTWADTAHTALYFSTDNGNNWRAIRDTKKIGRPPMVQTAYSYFDTPDSYDVYYSEGGSRLERAAVRHGTTPVVSAQWTIWNLGELAHADLTAIGFHTDKKSPHFLLGDGGIHRSEDKGFTWHYVGGGSKGYNALQLTEIRGQRQLNGKNHLYFATQDNDIWASADDGLSWTGKRCCEGFYLQIPEHYQPAESTKLVGVACAACGNFISGPVLSGQQGFPNAANNDGAPCMINSTTYIQRIKFGGIDTTIFQITKDSGMSWQNRFSFDEEVKDLPKISAGGTEPVLYVAVKLPGATPDGEEMLGIKRVVGLLRREDPLISDVSGFGSLGTFPTMFAWYKPFGVSPVNPNFIIVPDIIDEVVRVTYDGGLNWSIDTNLTKLVTWNGKFLFRRNNFTQISAFGFDPDFGNHILVGTRQAGIFETFDGGQQWSFLTGTEALPNISSFYFLGKGEVAVSTYGRGLWKIQFKIPERSPGLPVKRYLDLDEPLVYYRGVYIPLKDINNPDVCPVCGYYLLEAGKIAGFSLENGAMNRVELLSGKLQGFTLSGTRRQAPFEIRYVRELGKMGDDPGLQEFMTDQKLEIKGFYLQDRGLSGVILARKDIKPEDLPARKPRPPHIHVSLPSTGGSPLNSIGGIVVTGFGFDRRVSLEIALDGETVRPVRGPFFDSKGKFTFVLTVPGGIGGHTLSVRQKTAGAILQDVETFNLSVLDGAKE